MRGRRTTAVAGAALLLALRVLTGGAPEARGQPAVAAEEILLVGLRLAVNPDQADPGLLVVPRNVGSGVEARVVAADGSTALLPDLPVDALVHAELRGPTFAQPVPIAARPGEVLAVPPLPIAGLYSVVDIRLEAGGETLLVGEPSSVTLEVIEKLLVSQVSSRALSAEEILERGIFIDEENFKVVEFTVAFGVRDQPVPVSFPLILPIGPDIEAPAPVAAPSLPPLNAASVPNTVLPQLELALQTPNISVSGFELKVPEDLPDERALALPPIPGIIIIPGNIGFLNQFFSVLLMVSNAAPAHAELVVESIVAEILLPPPAPGTTDEPLRMARLGAGEPQSRLQPVRQPGPDAALGTEDDLDFIGPGDSADAEYLVEGVVEGVHTVRFEIKGSLIGLPGGPVPVEGESVGVVEVRDPDFALTFSHPHTVTAGEQYDFLVTVTNTSEVPANFVSLNLLDRSISGAELCPGQSESEQLDTIAAGDAATAAFCLEARTTGNVVATALRTPGVPGRFELRHEVGALDIPLSPNTLVLPAAADALPAAWRDAAVGFLGQALALATAPVTPQGLLPVGRSAIFDRATDVAQAGQRVGLAQVASFGDEELAAVARDLILDFAGSGLARLDEEFEGDETERALAERDFAGFDLLRRRSERARLFFAELAAPLGDGLGAAGVLEFHRAWAEAEASRPPHLSVLTGSGGGGAPAVLRITGPAGRELGRRGLEEDAARELPFGELLTLVDDAGDRSELAVIGAPGEEPYEVEVTGTGDGSLDLSLLLPDGQGLRRVAWSAVAVSEGTFARVGGSGDGADPFRLEVDDDADGETDRVLAPDLDEPVTDPGPGLRAVVQIVTGSPFDPSRLGKVVGLLFDEEVSVESAQDGLEPEELTHYAVEANQVLGAAVQPSRHVVLLLLREGVGPFVDRAITVTGLEDRRGGGMDPASITLPILATIERDGGIVFGSVRAGDGSPVARAQLRLGTACTGGDGLRAQDRTLVVKLADADGSYQFDYVPIADPACLAGARGFRLDAVDTESGERGELRTSIAFDGQELEVDVVLLGTGTVAGRTLAADGVTPLAGAFVLAASETRPGDRFGARSDDQGGFVIAGVPVGNLSLEAVHVETQSKRVLASAIPAAGASVIEDLVLLPLADPVRSGFGTIVGRVLRADGVTPVPGLTVFSSRGGTAESDATGAYRIEGVPAGAVRLAAIDQIALEAAQVRTSVVAGEETTANLLLFGGLGTVTGTVKDAFGDPVEGALVGGGLSLRRTDAAGVFVLPDVPVGSRTITALDETAGLQASATVQIAGPGDQAVAEIRFPGRGSIRGTVVDSAGEVVPDLKIFALGPSRQVGFTNALGKFQFDELALGPYTISAFLPDHSDGNLARTRLLTPGEERDLGEIAFLGHGSVEVEIVAFDEDNVLLLGGTTLGLSELEPEIGSLIPAENPLCLDTLEVGGQTLEFPPCEEVVVKLKTQKLNEVVTLGPNSSTHTFDDVRVGRFSVEAGHPFSGAGGAQGEIPAPGVTVPVTIQLAVTGTVQGVVTLPDGVTQVGENVQVFLRGRFGEADVVTDVDGRYFHSFTSPGAVSLRVEDAGQRFYGTARATVEAGGNAEVPIRLLGLGSVMVHVTGSAGDVEGALVSLRSASFPHEERMGTTDAAGEVRFAGGDEITEGRFSVFVEAAGVRGSASGVIDGDGSAALVEVVLADETGSVEGRFLRADETTPVPVPNAQVELQAAGVSLFDTTGTDGSFSFDGVRLGAFELEAFDPVTARRGLASGELFANGEIAVVDIIELPMGEVGGTVSFTPSGDPAPGAEVSIRVVGPLGEALHTTTGGDGRFRFPDVAAGRFTLQVRDPGTGLAGGAAGELRFEGEVLEIDVELEVPPVGRIEGTVSEAAGLPAQNASVELLRIGGTTTTVDGLGRFVFADVPLGDFELLARAAQGHDVGRVAGSLVARDEVLEIDVQLVGTGQVAGHVERADGTGVGGVRVELRGRSDAGTSVFEEDLTDAAGDFAFAGIPVGEVSLTAVDGDLGGTASGVLAGAGDTLELDVILEPAGEISGRVVREDGTTPAADMVLELLGSAVRFDRTDVAGRFAFTDVPLGPYQLKIVDPLGDGIAQVGTTLSAQGESVDLGDVVLDESAPEVVLVVPFDGFEGAPVTQQIEVHFSEPIDAGTVGDENLRVFRDAGPVAGSWTLENGDTLARFTPDAPYADFERISLKVTRDVLDRVGRELVEEVTSSFVTADVTPPQVVDVSPSDGANEVEPDARVRVTWSETVDPAAFAGQPIELACAEGPAAPTPMPVPGSVDFILGDAVAVFTPDEALDPNRLCTVTIAAASDLVGNRAPAPTLASFHTLDTELPIVQQLGVTPPQPGIGTVVQLVADVDGSDDVALVSFLLDGVVAAVDTTPPFAANVLIDPEPGQGVLVSAVATDFSGNAGPAASVLVVPLPDEPPEVEIAAPLSGALVPSGGVLAVTVQAQDDRGVGRVSLQVSGDLEFSDTTVVGPPATPVELGFEVAIPPDLAPGAMLTLRAAAEDDRGQGSIQAAQVEVVVEDATPPEVAIAAPAAGALVDPGALVYGPRLFPIKGPPAQSRARV